MNEKKTFKYRFQATPGLEKLFDKTICFRLKCKIQTHLHIYLSFLLERKSQRQAPSYDEENKALHIPAKIHTKN